MKTRNPFCNHWGKDTVENRIVESRFKVRILGILLGQDTLNCFKNTS